MDGGPVLGNKLRRSRWGIACQAAGVRIVHRIEMHSAAPGFGSSPERAGSMLTRQQRAVALPWLRALGPLGRLGEGRSHVVPPFSRPVTWSIRVHL